MHNPYRETGERDAYPKLNQPILEAPSYGRTYGCKCCSFGDRSLPDPIRFQANDEIKIEYAWCVNCLMHYKKILDSFNLFSYGHIWSNPNPAPSELVKLVWFTYEHIGILEHVVQNYHIPLIRYPRNITHWAQQWQPAPLPTKIFPSKVSSIIMRLKKMLGLK